MKYFIMFFQDYDCNYGVSYKNGDVIVADEKPLFKFIEEVKEKGIRVCIYKGEMICDLT